MANTRKKRRGDRYLGAPHLLEPIARPWAIHESVLDHSAVDTGKREAWVPKPGTRAQQLARLHEWYHVKVSPRNWMKVVLRIMEEAAEKDIMLDMKAVLHIVKMMEENRVDWLLWSRHKIDLRPCRDALDWSKLTIPEDNPLEATAWVLQLAWTVWASVGFGKDKVPKPPPPREPDPEAAFYFNECWKIVQQYNMDLAKCIIRACLTLYNEPTSRIRDLSTLEIARYFPVEPPPEMPEEKEEEKEKQKAIEEKEKQRDEQLEQDEEGGVDNPWSEIKGGVQYHDHTRGRRRPKVIIHKGWRPIDIGYTLRYAHRYGIDKYIFGLRSASEGSLMIDFSGSMTWDNNDLLYLLDKMPNIYIAGYSGVHDPKYYGRICVIAQNGTFNVFTGIDKECNGNNDVDVEALEVLATKPAPRFWLSDGVVVGGRYAKNTYRDAGPMTPLLKKPFESLPYQARAYIGICCDIMYRVNKIMQRSEILRVPDAATMRDLAAGKRVVLYKTCITEKDKYSRLFTGEAFNLSPVKFQL